ncbi:MAG: hypothetical protein ABEK59_11755 [Halobacteria archaeon]
MKDAEELFDEWGEGEDSGMRPKRVQELRQDLQEATGMYIPRRLPEIESYVERMRGHITRKLKKAASDDDEE